MMSLLVLGNLSVSNKQKEYLSKIASDVVYIDRATNELHDVISDFDYIISCNVCLNDFLESMKSHQSVIMAETGIVNVDIEEAQKRGIKVYNLETYSCDAVVQYILNCLFQKLRPWENLFSPFVSRDMLLRCQSTGLETLTIGILGFGEIGKALSRVLISLNCTVIANSMHPFLHDRVSCVTKEELFSSSNAIIICCRLNNTTKNVVDNRLLKDMKRNSILISISHRDIFNNEDLFDFLRYRTDVTAYLDFEPKEKDFEFQNENNIYISPHIAFYTTQTIINRTDACIDRLRELVA